MTDISPEMEVRFEEEAEWSLLADWQILSYHSLWEAWDNEEDAVYDALCSGGNMMMLSVKGLFVDGVARPVEPVEGYDQEEVIIAFLRSEEDAERAEFAEWKGASARTLQEIWDNDKDAVYDSL